MCRRNKASGCVDDNPHWYTAELSGKCLERGFRLGYLIIDQQMGWVGQRQTRIRTTVWLSRVLWSLPCGYLCRSRRMLKMSRTVSRSSRWNTISGDSSQASPRCNRAALLCEASFRQLFERNRVSKPLKDTLGIPWTGYTVKRLLDQTLSIRPEQAVST